MCAPAEEGGRFTNEPVNRVESRPLGALRISLRKPASTPANFVRQTKPGLPDRFPKQRVPLVGSPGGPDRRLCPPRFTARTRKVTGRRRVFLAGAPTVQRRVRSPRSRKVRWCPPSRAEDGAPRYPL